MSTQPISEIYYAYNLASAVTARVVNGNRKTMIDIRPWISFYMAQISKQNRIALSPQSWAHLYRKPDHIQSII